MRQIGKIDTQDHALRFAAFLLIDGIEAQVEQGTSDDWLLWVRDEDQLDDAVLKLKAFKENPEDPKYDDAEAQAKAIQRERIEKLRLAKKNVVEMRGKWNRGSGGQRRPLVIALTVISVITFIATDFGEISNKLTQAMLFRNPVTAFSYLTAPSEANGNVDADSLSYRLVSIDQGQVWRLVTPIFLHFSPMHIAFNMIWLFIFGGPIENRYGTWFLLLLVVTIAVVSNFLQGVMPERLDGSVGNFGGMSGVVYGLFGFAWMKSMYDPASGLRVPQSTVVILLVFMLLGMSHILDNVMRDGTANWCHGGGLVTGMAMGYLPIWFAGLKRR